MLVSFDVIERMLLLLKVMSPELGISNPAIRCSKVDLPAPDLPVIPIKLDSSMDRLISFKTFSSSLLIKNDFERLMHSILFMS